MGTQGPSAIVLPSPVKGFEPSIRNQETSTALETGKEPALTYSIRRDDGALLHYRVEGNIFQESPNIVLVNEILTNSEIWDPVASRLMRENPSFRIIRYDIRGYSAESLGSDPMTLNVLACDLHALLTHLGISRVHCLIGLGLGASISLTYLGGASSVGVPVPVASFVGMGFYLPSSPSTPEREMRAKWADRDRYSAQYGMATTGAKAAARWFSADARDSAEWKRVREIVARGSFDGMNAAAAAAVESVSMERRDGANIQACLENLEIPALFLCGASDGMLPEEMEEYPSLMKRSSGEFSLIYRTGRMACCEHPDQVAGKITEWLSSLWKPRPDGRSPG